MNTAMTLYDKHFHDNKSENKINELFEEAIKLEYIRTDKPQGIHLMFKDKSQLIFTHDNVQVTLF